MSVFRLFPLVFPSVQLSCRNVFGDDLPPPGGQAVRVVVVSGDDPHYQLQLVDDPVRCDSSTPARAPFAVPGRLAPLIGAAASMDAAVPVDAVGQSAVVSEFAVAAGRLLPPRQHVVAELQPRPPHVAVAVAEQQPQLLRPAAAGDGSGSSWPGGSGCRGALAVAEEAVAAVAVLAAVPVAAAVVAVPRSKVASRLCAVPSSVVAERRDQPAR